MKELYLCTVAPLSSLWPPPLPTLPKLNVQYIQTKCGCGGGGWIVLWTIFCRSFTLGSDQIQNLQNCFTTPNKMTSKDEIKGLVSWKFLRPWFKLSLKFLWQHLIISAVFKGYLTWDSQTISLVSPQLDRWHRHAAKDSWRHIWYSFFH
jgi:hypothetical protein